MLKGGDNPSGNTWARACHTCRSSPCRVYCRADAAYLCSACDARVHAANRVSSRHERVWVCESCERSPAAFLCKADSSSLCPDCDAHVHSANPLARRHHRLPILPLSFHHSGGRRAGPFPIAEAGDDFDDEDEDEAASWLLLNPFSNTNNNKGNKINNDDDNNHNGCIVGGEADEYLDMVEYTSGTVDDNSQLCDELYNHHGSRGPPYDSVAPNGTGKGKEVDDRQNFQMGVDSYDIKSGYEDYNNSSISHNVSVLSLDVCTVPEPTMSDNSTSNQWPWPPKGTIDLFSDPPVQQMPTQLSPTDRHARVMRYREKKKTRKFEKTIRYASRKAYAETRPRIKGRFARRSKVAVEVEVDQMFPNAVMADGGYGIVPSF